ncbi:MAG: DNA gyrase C-terminal beta-propeller domain-containing protein [Mollicutes bacterium]|nr:MAG: DNA gyrase C-terminal beta-propeller domain-containing protein [Mollicutes bacterium]
MSTIIAQDKFNDIDEEDLIAQKRVLVCITKNNYLKRVDLDLFRNQKRGGVGIKGITLNEGDEVKQVLQANTHDNLLFFTDRGKVYQLKA